MWNPPSGPDGSAEGAGRAAERAHCKCVSEVRRAATPGWADPGPTSVEAADDADELPLDPHVVVELRRVLGVRRLEADLVLLLEEPLQGDRVLLDLGHDDVAVAGRRLGPDQDIVAVG